MKAIVLSPGPSLARYVPRPADLTLAVNRAATAFAAGAWVCGDTPLVEQIGDQVIGAPVLVTYGVTMDTLRDHKFTWRNEVVSWSPIAENWLHTSIVNWPWCSFASAIVYAAWRGATMIDVYGADWRGTEDFDGVQAGKNRSEDRWAYERTLFANLRDVLASRGVTVNRYES